jgi:hypothetical protein
MNPIRRWYIIYRQPSDPKEIREDLISSIDSSYTLPEIKEIMAKVDLKNWKAEQTPSQIVISGRKSMVD